MIEQLGIFFSRTPIGFLTVALLAWTIVYCIRIAKIPQADLRLQKSIGGMRVFRIVLVFFLVNLLISWGKDDSGSALVSVIAPIGIALGALGILGLWWATKRGLDSKHR
jgi:hypothetical protein